MRSTIESLVTRGRPITSNRASKPRPSPRAKRPPVRACIVAPKVAVTSGCRVWGLVAAVAMPTRSVTAATAPESVGRVLHVEPLRDEGAAQAQALAVAGLGDDRPGRGGVAGQGVEAELVEGLHGGGQGGDRPGRSVAEADDRIVAVRGLGGQGGVAHGADTRWLPVGPDRARTGGRRRRPGCQHGPVPTSRRFQQVDVFAERPLRGNPVAVVVDGDDLDEEVMQATASWTNLSETTFLLPPSRPGADYRVRIFTATRELPFAGHPTLGSAHAWLHAGGGPATPGVVVQECGAGLVRLRHAHGRLAFAAPPCRTTAVDAERRAAVEAALGLAADDVLDVRHLDNGAPWLTLRLTSAARVLALEPDHGALAGLGEVAVVGAHPDGSPSAFELRAFAASVGITEDPATGSLNAAVAQWLVGEGLAPPSYVAAQGTRLRREGRIHVEVDGDDTWIGGATTTLVDGTLAL